MMMIQAWYKREVIIRHFKTGCVKLLKYILMSFIEFFKYLNNESKTSQKVSLLGYQGDKKVSVKSICLSWWETWCVKKITCVSISRFIFCPIKVDQIMQTCKIVRKNNAPSHFTTSCDLLLILHFCMVSPWY